ncbi:thioredoxin-like protein AAED1 isoform X2 [Pundamilia nyererei]|uniref:Thioredoxin-like protein AAED1 isoform X2 n=1 Tax=Pundamilia nyererei TaxID=303518 RepID=A0A9Y6JH21_9CICH|nr:PREDICTED: thioredoxin-like protein AAED1 isoform X2 [Pundamilia nyererei]
MAEVVSPITRQVTKGSQENVTCFVDINLRDVEDCLIYDRHGVSIPFKTLYQDRKSVIIFVRSFCLLTEYPYEIYVDPERRIYQKLGMKREETFTDSAQPSPHVKSGVFMGQIKTIWRAMTSPAFDFQGDLHQQGGAIIAGPGSKVHFSHLDMNRLDHMPINWLLQLAGAQKTIEFSDKPKIIHI